MKRSGAMSMLLVVTSLAAVRTAPAGTTCEAMLVPVSLAPGLPADQQIYAELSFKSIRSVPPKGWRRA